MTIDLMKEVIKSTNDNNYGVDTKLDNYKKIITSRLEKALESETSSLGINIQALFINVMKDLIFNSSDLSKYHNDELGSNEVRIDKSFASILLDYDSQFEGNDRAFSKDISSGINVSNNDMSELRDLSDNLQSEIEEADYQIENLGSYLSDLEEQCSRIRDYQSDIETVVDKINR